MGAYRGGAASLDRGHVRNPISCRIKMKAEGAWGLDGPGDQKTRSEAP